MNDDERIELMARYGHALLKPTDIAVLLDIPSDDVELFCHNLKESQSPEAKAYRRGIANAKLELHENVVKLAVKGSPAAQPLVDTYLRDL